MSQHNRSLRRARIARLASLALWGALLLAAPSALAAPAKPRIFPAAACQAVKLASRPALVCQAKSSTAVLVQWVEFAGPDGAKWIAGWTKSSQE